MAQPIAIHTSTSALMARTLVPITFRGKPLCAAGKKIKVFPSGDGKNYYGETKTGRQFVIPGTALEILGKVE